MRLWVIRGGRGARCGVVRSVRAAPLFGLLGFSGCKGYSLYSVHSCYSGYKATSNVVRFYFSVQTFERVLACFVFLFFGYF